MKRISFQSMSCFHSIFYSPRLNSLSLLQLLSLISRLQRGKFFPQLTNLVRINTPKAVQTETRKAFRKLPNLESALASLTNLKGVGTTLASGWSSCHKLATFFVLNPTALMFKSTIFVALVQVLYN